MYWDILEVKPELNYCLFVRFKDGLTGRLQLRREELTGVLAPLLDVKFFEQVFMIAARSHGPVRSIWHRMQCMIKSPASGISRALGLATVPSQLRRYEENS